MGLKVGIEPQGWDLSLEAGISASRLGFELRGWDFHLKGGGRMEKKEEKFLLCESIGHRLLRGRCPKKGAKGSKRKNKQTKQKQKRQIVL